VARNQVKAAEAGARFGADFHLSFESARALFSELTPSRIDLLEALRRCGPCSVYALAKEVARNYSNVHTDVAKLEEHGLVQRTPEDAVFVPFESLEIRLTLAMKAANARAAQRLATNPTAVAARYDRRVGRVVIALSSGLEIAFKPHDAQGLELARPAQLAEIEISPSGLGLHFPKLDADLYLPALLEGFLGSRRWMASASAARANGSLGGRPRKAPPVETT
jgi:predicted transcriptional regulator